jgi:hypothetical protein
MVAPEALIAPLAGGVVDDGGTAELTFRPGSDGCSRHPSGPTYVDGCGQNLPDNQAHNAPAIPAQYALSHSAHGVGTPKMPGERPGATKPNDQ